MFLSPKISRIETIEFIGGMLFRLERQDHLQKKQIPKEPVQSGHECLTASYMM